MTSNRNQKAAVRAFAAARDISYTEARRLMGLDELRWEVVDEVSGVTLEATMRGNLIELHWEYPDGSASNRAARTHVLLGLDLWPSSANHAGSIFTSDGALRPAWDEDPVLPTALTQRLRDWVAKVVQKPSVLSEEEENFLYHSRQPEDYAVTIVDKRAGAATVHVFRNPEPVEAPDASPSKIVADHARRYLNFETAVQPALAAQYHGRNLTNLEDFYTYSSFTLAEQQLADIFYVHRFVASSELRHDRAGNIDPEQLSWSVVEHVDF